MLLFRIFNSLLGNLGYKVIKNRVLPPPNLEILDLYFQLISQSHSECYFIQIGACDGVVSDQAVNHINSPMFHSVLVEPVPANFTKLKHLHQGNENIKLLNVAVSHADGNGTLYTVADEGRWQDSPVARQIASFDRGHLLRFGVKEFEIKPIEIECMSLTHIFKSSAFPRIDLLQIDTEGFDAEVVKMALDLEIKPRAIYFEYCQIRKILSKPQLDDLYVSLSNIQCAR